MKAWLAQTRWYQKLLLGLVCLYLLYLLLTPLLLAFWGRAKLVDELTALTGKQVRLDALYFNPLTNSLTLKDFAIANTNGDIIRVGRLSADLELGPLLDHQLYLRDLTVMAPYVKLVRLADGSINLQHLIKPQPKPAATTPPAETGLPLMPVIANLALNDGRFELVDSSLAQPASVTIDQINLRSHDLSLTPDRQAPFQLALAFAKGGKLTVDGKLGLEPLALTADIRLAGLALTQANPWLASIITGQLASGQLQTELSLSLADKDVQLQGQAQLQQLQLDAADGNKLLAWDELAATGFALDTKAQRVALDAIDIGGLSGAFAVFKDGKTSVDRLLAVPAKAAPASAKPAKANTSAEPAQPWQVAVKQIKLVATELVFDDQSVTPTYQLTAKPLTLTFGALDSTSSTPADLDMRTKLGGYAPLSVSGKVNAFATRPQVDLAIRLTGYDMTNLTPYTGAFIGYQVQKGQLGVNTDMALKGSLLTSKSRIDANNFYLGDKVKSPDAITAPVKFGLSILRDNKGNIGLPLKVAGDLSDPSVSVHGLVLQALLNVLTKAATAPLSALSLLAGGVDLEKVSFAAGSASVDKAQLEPLAKVLVDKPGLKLGLTGSSSKQDAELFSAQGKSGEALAQALKELADARAKTLKLALVDDFAIAAERLYLEQPQTAAKVTGVALSAINQ